MPSPINHRDITLTQTNRDGSTQHRHQVHVHLDATTIAGVISLPFSELSTPGDFSKHELRILELALPKVKIFWDIECSYDPSGQGTDTPGDSAAQYRDPATTAAANQSRPSTAALWEKDVNGGWAVKVYRWKTVPSGWSVNETVTTGSDGMTWGLTIKKGSATKFEGTLTISVPSETVLVLTKLGKADLAKIYTTGVIRKDLVPYPQEPDGRKKSAKKAATKATKKATKA